MNGFGGQHGSNLPPRWAAAHHFLPGAMLASQVVQAHKNYGAAVSAVIHGELAAAMKPGTLTDWSKDICGSGSARRGSWPAGAGSTPAALSTVQARREPASPLSESRHLPANSALPQQWRRAVLS